MPSKSARRRRRQNRLREHYGLSYEGFWRDFRRLKRIENEIKAVEAARHNGRPLHDSRGHFRSAKPLIEKARQLYTKIFKGRHESAEPAAA